MTTEDTSSGRSVHYVIQTETPQAVNLISEPNAKIESANLAHCVAAVISVPIRQRTGGIGTLNPGKYYPGWEYY